ncbi:MAG TPA: FeoA family protein [Fibrobacteria bacterium]|nr:FeoA family protein [Fibrobacteria bacterium]
MVKIAKGDSPLPSSLKGPGADSALESASCTTLDALKPGQSAVIDGIHADPALRLHLMEMGFVAGSPITFLMSTPFRDPNIYSLRGTSIALRRSEAQCIRVRA